MERFVVSNSTPEEAVLQFYRKGLLEGTIKLSSLYNQEEVELVISRIGFSPEEAQVLKEQLDKDLQLLKKQIDEGVAKSLVQSKPNDFWSTLSHDFKSNPQPVGWLVLK